MNKEIKRQITQNLFSWQFWLSRIIINFLIMVVMEWFYYRMGWTGLWTAQEFLMRLVIYTFTSFLTASLAIILWVKIKNRD